MAFQKTYAEALEKQQSKPAKPRKPMSRGTAGLNRGSLSQNRAVRGRDGNTPIPLNGRGIARKGRAGASGKAKRPKKKTDGQLKKGLYFSREAVIYIAAWLNQNLIHQKASG